MTTERSTKYLDGDRYAFDFKECHFKHGFAQLDTESDAWYYGIWANPTTLKIVSYCEGDITRQTAETPEEFAAEIRSIAAFGGADYFKGIDPMGVDAIADGFRAVGLGDLLHGVPRSGGYGLLKISSD